MFKKISSSFPQIIALLFVAAFAVYAWQEPAQAPPEGNVPSPLNVGPQGQSKEGGLILNTGGAEVGLIVDKGKVCISEDCRTGWPTLAIFGDGSDGDVTIASDTTLNRDMFYNNLTVDPGVTLNPNGYRIFVKNTLVNNGVVARDGNPGIPGAYSASSPGGSGLEANTLGGSAQGGPSAFRGGGPGDNISSSLGGTGGSGGDIVDCGGDWAGGQGGQVSPPKIGIKAITNALQLYDYPLDSLINGGAGGGGGAGSISPTFGGGGGSGGGVIMIAGKIIQNYGIIRANGGDGGPGWNYYCTTGGGGGGGGVVVLIYQSAIWNIEEVAEGAGGAKASSGFAPGNPGFPGTVSKLNVKNE